MAHLTPTLRGRRFGTRHVKAMRKPHARTRLLGSGKNPVERQDAQESRAGDFTVPAAIGLLAEDFHLTENVYNFCLGYGFPTAFPLEVDLVTLGAFENESVSVAHAQF
jgi:hypothetical protein